MKKINSNIKEHICFYNTCIKELKEAHPNLTDEKLKSILENINVLDTKSIAIKGLLWPFGLSNRELLFIPLAMCFNTIRKMDDDTKKFICKLFSIWIDLLYTFGVFYFLMSWFSLGHIDIGMLFLPLGCSFIYYMASRFFNYSYLISEVEWYCYQESRKEKRDI